MGEQSRRNQNTPAAALAELRKRLSDGLAASGMDKTQLARRAALGRTTVSEAFQQDGPVPSARTVAVLAEKLGLPPDELLALRRTAATEDSDLVHEGESAPGKPIGQWEPHDLEVHPAGTAFDGLGVGGAPQPLPGYVRRAHDLVLAQAVQDAKAGQSRLLVLVGSSSTGKTRACWEAVQPLADEGWRLWHPFDPTRAEAALEALERVRPHTVLWLNEAQHYLGDGQSGERIAASVHTLLTDPGRAPVLVLGTLWPDYDRQYSALPLPGRPDPHSRARELLAGRTLSVPERFDAEALRSAFVQGKEGDRLLADALTRAGAHGRVTQDLAGAPELLRRYERGTPPARALLEAAMDARRLGVALHLPQTFLTDAAFDYLAGPDCHDLADDWPEAAIAELAHPVHGKQAPMRPATVRPASHAPEPPSATSPAPATTPALRLADYLEQYARATRRWLCPPASFWLAAHTHLTNPDDLNKVAGAAQERCRLQWATRLYQRAADVGSTKALGSLAVMREQAGDRAEAESLARQASDAGDPSALLNLATMRDGAGDQEGAEALARRLAESGHTIAVLQWAVTRQWAQSQKVTESLSSRPGDGDLRDVLNLAALQKWTEDRRAAESLYPQTLGTGDLGNRLNLARLRELARDRATAEAFARQLADAGNTFAVKRLAWICEKAGVTEGFRIDKWWPYGLDPDGTPTQARH
ncbi:helix-turn-helix domain-containing protein [Streptomyces sp. W16]|uniref:helix-turn-helix domain-containing protein n=1 Tax=Streptomyces sp. W16 TaxID=3076631 RepID=UPI00295B369C|nr:helix-turn-helix domain-containing protein [Streptomyces sp. W16]MDV9170074.1 helix-turn-helix domain-containing protein [Streptomyces sp. W16]